jgi:hypothetical protein
MAVKGMIGSKGTLIFAIFFLKFSICKEQDNLYI